MNESSCAGGKSPQKADACFCGLLIIIGKIHHREGCGSAQSDAAKMRMFPFPFVKRVSAIIPNTFLSRVVNAFHVPTGSNNQSCKRRKDVG